MTAGLENPAASKIRLGNELATLIKESGFDLKFVADQLGCTDRKVRRILDGETGVKSGDLIKLLDLLKVSRDKRIKLEALGKASQKRRPRVPGGTVIPDKWQRMYQLEEAAQGIWEYANEFIPGLLQTANYARSLYEGAQQHQQETIDLWIQSRLNRQSRLIVPDGPKLHYILAEGTLHWLVGNSKIMREQLFHLIELQKLNQITIQVMPFSAGAHIGFGYPFVIFQQPAGTVDRVSLENMFDSLILDEEERVGPYRQMFLALTKQALLPQDSDEMLATVAKGL